VGLGEGEGVEVGWEGIVAGVFEVWRWMLATLSLKEWDILKGETQKIHIPANEWTEIFSCEAMFAVLVTGAK
jgi:hypothetical protein